MSMHPRTLGTLGARGSRAPLARSVLLPASRFIHVQELSGGPLLVAGLGAVLWANSPFAASYDALWESKATLELFGWSRTESVRHWITDLLLPFFFFVAGLEIKRELVRGELSDWRSASFPVAVAAGGMLVPAALYLVVAPEGAAARGWGIPMATDIAFALGVLALLGDRIPQELKILVLAFAAVDDVGATLAIALFYSAGPEWPVLGAAAAVFAGIAGMRAVGVAYIGAYWAAGALFVLVTLESGIHTTVAGVALGLLAPARVAVGPGEFARRAEEVLERLRAIRDGLGELPDEGGSRGARRRRHELETEEQALLGVLEQLAVDTESIVERLTRTVTPWVSYAVLPLFALAAAGVDLSLPSLRAALSGGPGLGVFAGLLLGKPVGFLLFGWAAVRLGVAEAPSRVGFRQLAGAGIVAGMGFTVSLFIAELAFADTPELLRHAKVATFTASALAGALGWLFLRVAVRGGGEDGPEAGGPEAERGGSR